jgi:hypothetical protein
MIDFGLKHQLKSYSLLFDDDGLKSEQNACVYNSFFRHHGALCVKPYASTTCGQGPCGCLLPLWTLHALRLRKQINWPTVKAYLISFSFPTFFFVTSALDP